MSGELYLPIYLTIVTFFTLIIYRKYKVVTGELSTGNTGLPGTFLLAIACTLFIGFRPDWYGFIDSRSYIGAYLRNEGSVFRFDTSAENLIFDNLFNWITSMSLGWDIFFLIIAAIYFMCAWFACYRIFGANNTDAAYLVFLAAFSTFSYATNGIKAGAATSIFLLALSYRDNLKIGIPLVLLSWGFHHSMQLPVLAFFLTMVIKNTRVYLVFWGICLLLSMFHVTYFQEIFSGYSDARGSEYLLSDSSDDWGGKSGFRYDFALYSVMPIVVGWWALYKKKLEMSSHYKSILGIYLMTNGVWSLCMYASFNNRIAYLSWFLYPFVLIYPFLKEDWGPNKYSDFSKVALLHLAFTLFMEIVYY